MSLNNMDICLPLLVTLCCSIYRVVLSQDTCKPGYKVNPYETSMCIDINECESSSCESRKRCVNTVGSYWCECNKGFKTVTQGYNREICEDINECDSSPCAHEATCQNTDGSFHCVCSTGFNSSETIGSNGRRTCEDIDECKSSPCKNHTTCNNTLGSYQCNCIAGFQASPATTSLAAGKVCEDIDECKSLPCDQHANCNNMLGSYQCSCSAGLKLTSTTINSTGRRTCEDVNECEDKNVCSTNTTCRNAFGSYYCVCAAGFHPGSGEAHQACTVDPLDCSGSEKQNSTVSQCNPQQSWNSNQLNSAGDLMNLSKCYHDKVCQNFSGTTVIKEITTFANNVLNISLLDTMKTAQRLEVATATVELLENMAMALALTLSNSKINTIEEKSFVLKIQVAGGKNMSVDQVLNIQAWSNAMEMDWRTIAGENNTDFVAVSFLVFNNMDSLLNREIKGGRPTQRNVPLNSKVISATISNKAASIELRAMINFTLKLNQERKDNEKTKCVYWKKTKVESVWSPEGCSLILSNQTHALCQCNHLTSFAVLMAPVEIEDDSHLEMITYIGLIISLLCLAASIVVFVKCRSIQNANTTVHKHLSLTLFLAQFFFLIGMRIKNKMVCALIAGCLHYLFLAVFAWMFLDSLQLFVMSRHLTVTNYTRTHIIKRRYLYVSGYAVPAVIVIISAAIYGKGYGSEKHCWLKHKSGFNWSFQGPVCFVIVVNTVLLVWTLCSLKHHFDTRNKQVSKLKETRTLTLKAAARMFVLGCTWVLGIFQVDDSTMLFSHLFTVINTLQGLFVFLIYCVFNRQVMAEFRKWLTSKHKIFNTESSQVEMNSTENNK